MDDVHYVFLYAKPETLNCPIKFSHYLITPSILQPCPTGIHIGRCHWAHDSFTVSSNNTQTQDQVVTLDEIDDGPSRTAEE